MRALRAPLVHAITFVALGLLAATIYSAGLVASPDPFRIVLDGVLVVAGLAVAVRNRDVFGSLHPAVLIASVVIGFGMVIAMQAIVPDQQIVSLDESSYLAMVRAGGIVRDGTMPFNLRWLAPLLAGRLNVLPVEGGDALRAINCAALCLTATYLTLLVIRLRVPVGYAVFVPVVLCCSYLGLYAARNRLVIDPVNYAMWVALFHVLLRREDWRYFPVVLLVAACNSEKAIYWLPVFAVVAWLRDTPIARTAKLAAIYGAPTLAYLALLVLYLHGAERIDEPLYLDTIYATAFTWLDPAAPPQTNFQMIWFPFGAFTVYALLGLTYCERWLRALALLIVPVLLQAFIAHDTQRMVAYAFIVYIPFGYVYLAHTLATLPRAVAIALYAASLAILLANLGAHHSDSWKLAMSAAELICVFAIVFGHLLVGRDAQPR